MSHLALKQLLDQLLMGGYVIMDNGKYVFTPKFYADIVSTAVATIPNMLPSTIPVPTSKPEFEMLFIKLIADAQVPKHLPDNKGGVYAANKFSETGLKAFMAAIKNGVNYELLVKSVMLYYKSSTNYKKAVGNYFAQGDWRTDYEALAASTTSPEALNQHIKSQINNESKSHFKLG
jgi:hypothetical protein